jgi:hypothetical protein
MTWAGWVLVGLAGGFLVLALYGKYRKIREEFLEARQQDSERRMSLDRGEDPEPGP